MFGCRTETAHFWLYVDKAKMRLRGGGFLLAIKNLFTIFSCLFPIFQKKSSASKTHFSFTNIGSKVHQFSSTAILLLTFSIRTPFEQIQCLTQFQFLFYDWNMQMMKNNKLVFWCIIYTKKLLKIFVCVVAVFRISFSFAVDYVMSSRAAVSSLIALHTTICQKMQLLVL